METTMNSSTQTTTFENTKWRIELGALSVKATEMVHAGKRGKQCVQMYLAKESSGGSKEQLVMAYSAMTELAAREASAVEMAAAMAPLVTADVCFDTTKIRGVDVVRGCDVVEIVGPALRVRADSATFCLSCTKNSNEPTLVSLDEKGPALVGKWARKNAGAIAAGMTFSCAKESLRAMGVSAHFFCAVD
jgi:hypothetical protein